MLTLTTLLVLPLLAWLLWDIDRQQKRRAARAAARASVAAQMADLSRAFYSFRVQVVDNMTPALQKAAAAVAQFFEALTSEALTTDPLSSRTRERGGRAQTPASPSLGEDGGDAGTNAPNTETGAGGG